ncbi:glycosyltransferase [Periweissella cryptocerci]|uniref:Glycosyltransferase n=1 Tax=Periweissella cryptocerci TaxID=2506420 RepID=A0A4P6YTX6_9LACO|nr:glycosyltransferase [Periweissella cryptocerci]QBO36146.1 glycosyltransferase [Periweissella cryptocerci]
MPNTNTFLKGLLASGQKSFSYNQQITANLLIEALNFVYIDEQFADILPKEQSINEYVGNLIDYVANNELNLTVATMVKNQEDNIGKMINSVSNIVDSIYILDTGSTDKTVDVVKSEINVNPSIKLFKKNWIEDYAQMRNYMINLISDNADWILFIDSDETMTPPMSKKLLHIIINMVDYMYAAKSNLVIQLHTTAYGTETFAKVDRIIRVKDGTRFVGKVHEEILPSIDQTDAEINGIYKVESKINVVNMGRTQGQEEKFNKKERYNKLLLEMLKDEPHNIRLLSLLNSEMLNYTSLGEQYIPSIYEAITNNKDLPFSVYNVNHSDYLLDLLKKYISYLISQNEITDALRISEESHKLFPQNYTILFSIFSLKFHALEVDAMNLTTELVASMAALDPEAAYRSSQENTDIITALIIRLYLMQGKIEQAKQLKTTITDSRALGFLGVWEEFLT